MHDGFQRDGEGAQENSGLVELIIMQGEIVEHKDFTFTPFTFTPPASPAWHDDEEFGSFRSGGEMYSFGAPGASSSLGGGETRYRPPQTVNASMASIRDVRAIAAFRFALAGAP